MLGMYTIAETTLFTTDAKSIWTDSERSAFINWISVNHEAGDVIPSSGGCRKVRWSRAGIGKRGGVRIIYFNMIEKGKIWLLVIYAKSVRGNIPAHILKSIKEAIEHD